MMQVRFEIDCSPNEVRRLAGGADVSPLAELIQCVAERTLIEMADIRPGCPESLSEMSGARGRRARRHDKVR